MMQGGLVHLVSYGASDVYLFGNTGDPYTYNHRDAMMYWFIDRNDGYACKEDMVSVQNMPGLLDHVPEMMKPINDCIASFSIKKEKACVKIQRTWRNAISNPIHPVCIRRLMRDFSDLKIFSFLK